ncbi:MAG TPA: cytidylate kinase family protein, partial [Bacillota bacterium]|nr:cytidylate kinase family protein [Bacillota bacterium]
MRRIITIARQFGSGGTEIGKKLSEILGIAYYDKESLIEAAESN